VLYGTRDGGRHWQRLAGRGLPPGGEDLELTFAAGGSGWLTGGGGALYRTGDGGQSWERLPVSEDPTVSASDQLQILAPTIGAGGRAVLPVYDRGHDRVWVLASEDGGATWRDPRPLPVGGAISPAFVDVQTGWTTTAAAAWSTGDGGRTWRQAASPGQGWMFGSIVVPVSDRVAWVDARRAAGTDAGGSQPWTLFRTSDAGRHWTRVALPGLS
jgi:photosystem II stability/assembly factor-like uncharacterized protein